MGTSNVDGTRYSTHSGVEHAAKLQVLGVEYVHLRLHDGTDLYLTEWGLPFLPQLLPENHWGDKDWFGEHSVRLPGTSTVYRAQTKAVGGPSKDIVLKWNRMGQDIPGETEASELMTAEFNSPFQEFSLVKELRKTRRNSCRPLLTHKPFAILVPRKLVELERLGRKLWRLEAIQRSHREVMLDPQRQYAVLYEWIKGVDAGEVMQRGVVEQDIAQALLARANEELAQAGFRVRDSKPHHLILSPDRKGDFVRDRGGRMSYALVDFELLERTPQHEREVRASRRHSYLSRQPRRFEPSKEFPPGLTQVNIMGVDYVHGAVESSAGALWVVGDDPDLFDYSLPEKWRRTPFVKDKSKDNIPPVLQAVRFCRGHVADVMVIDRVCRSSTSSSAVSSRFVRVSSWLDLGSFGGACPRPVGHPFVGAGVPGSGPTHEIVKPELLPGAQSKPGPRRAISPAEPLECRSSPGGWAWEHTRRTQAKGGNGEREYPNV
jgi:hypothetical protein